MCDLLWNSYHNYDRDTKWNNENLPGVSYNDFQNNKQ